jgi:DNA-binding winged helix-turn-helix (wHTH) protein
LSARAFSFGEFRLLPEERALLAAGKPVRISSRALDILIMLVDHAGELVSKNLLIERAWPDTRVEENNLRVHIGALRKLLGEGPAGVSTIATVPGRGYSFVASVQRESVQPLLATVPPTVTAPALPASLTRMIGRAETLVLFLSRMRKQRLVTIIGPGGMGKTTIALAMAERLSRSLEHHASFVDLSPVADPQLLPSALASVLGIASRSDNPLFGLLAFLRDKRMLIVLDSCEHLVEAAAAMVEALLKGAPGVQILATSREPLGVEGEWVERLAPLGLPSFLPPRLLPFRPFNCSRNARPPASQASSCQSKTCRRRWRSARSWTAFRSPLSWPPRGWDCSGFPDWRGDSTTVWRC